jgi:hypothetical protein
MEISYIYDGRGTNIAERLEKCEKWSATRLEKCDFGRNSGLNSGETDYRKVYFFVRLNDL